jgi:DNA-binding NarL/FixJ family response regulator
MEENNMKLPQVCIIMNKISDLSETALLKLPNNITEIRKKVNMLVIDDNEFQPEKFLIANGYQIQHKYDIDTIKDVEPYDVVLCDISGIGKKLGFTNEGASLIREIHKNYPNKRIIAYTAYTFDPGLNQFFSLADFVAPKDFGVDDWISVLDEQITESINPVNQWKKIRDYLLEINVSTIMIARIEDKYVKAVKDRHFEKLKQFVEGNDSQIRSIISDFLSSLCAKIILGIIRGA